MSTLTRREEFVKAAMQAVASAGASWPNESDGPEIARRSVAIADATLAALDKDPTELVCTLAEWDQLNDIRNAAFRVVSSRCGNVIDQSAMARLEKTLEARP